MTLRSGEILGIAGISGNWQDALTKVLVGEIRTPAWQGAPVMLKGQAIGGLGRDARRAWAACHPGGTAGARAHAKPRPMTRV